MWYPLLLFIILYPSLAKPMNYTSTSESNGINFLSSEDRKIYSVGISTGGGAEIKMALQNAKLEVIATTIDLEGAEFAKKCIEEASLSDQIAVKIEDVSKPLPYPDETFDYIYARLVLHYLPKDKLTAALSELHRVLRKEGRIFVVVRSMDCLEAKLGKFDPGTHLTTYSSYSRYFHSKGSITRYLSAAGFTISHTDSYQERLCVDFQRTKLADQIDSLIEVVGIK